MASSHGSWIRCPHAHNHNHCRHCPLRRHCRHCPLHNHNPHHFASLPQQVQNPHQHLSPLIQLQQPIFTSNTPPLVSQELDHIELDVEEEDEEPVFVLTDEWKEFFAKSEAKRKLEKKQGKKGKK